MSRLDQTLAAEEVVAVDRSKAFQFQTSERPSLKPQLPLFAGVTVVLPQLTKIDQWDDLEARLPRVHRVSCAVHWFVTAPPDAVVIFLHGAGGSGAAAKRWADQQWGGRLLTSTRAAFLFPDSGAVSTDGIECWSALADGAAAAEDSAEWTVEPAVEPAEPSKRASRQRVWYRTTASSSACPSTGPDADAAVLDAAATSESAFTAEGLTEVASGEGTELPAGLPEEIATLAEVAPRACAPGEEGIGGDELLEASAAEVGAMVAELELLVREVVARGVPAGRVFVGGVGHGGGAALHVALALAARRHHPVRLGGAFSMGGGLAARSCLFEAPLPPPPAAASAVAAAKEAPAAGADEGPSSTKALDTTSAPPLLLCHARDDPAVPCADGKRTVDLLRRHGSVRDGGDPEAVRWFPYPGTRHDGAVRSVASWINELLDEPTATMN
jgi:predicted esterase